MKKKASFLLALIIPLIILFGGVIWWKINSEPVDITGNNRITFTVSKGAGLDEIAEKLKQQNLIKNPLHFKISVYLSGIAKKIQAGDFFLSPSMPEEEIACSLTKATNDKWVTIVEGLRSEQIGELLIKQGFEISMQSWTKQIRSEELEGKIFPDSYLIPPSSTQGAVLKIINRNFQKKVEQGLSGKISGSKMTLNQILTLASIIEREAKNDADRAIIAGILLKRMENDWPLQVDATVQYAVASKKCVILKNCDWWPKSLTSDDLHIKSPYNTYIYQGLPPSPICNPGLSSINAVLSPKASLYWYYISDPSGAIHYAKTDTEHIENIRKYLK